VRGGKPFHTRGPAAPKLKTVYFISVFPANENVEDCRGFVFVCSGERRRRTNVDTSRRCRHSHLGAVVRRSRSPTRSTASRSSGIIQITQQTRLRVAPVALVVSSSSCRACRAVLFDKLDTAKMRWLDTSNVLSCRVET